MATTRLTSPSSRLLSKLDDLVTICEDTVAHMYAIHADGNDAVEGCECGECEDARHLMLSAMIAAGEEE